MNSWSRISTVADFPFLSESDHKAVERLNAEIEDLLERRQRAGAVADPIFQRYAADQAQDRGPAFKAILPALQVEEGIRQKLVGYYAACDAARQAAILDKERQMRELETAAARKLDWPEGTPLADAVKVNLKGWRRLLDEMQALQCGGSNTESIANEQELAGLAQEIDSVQRQILSEPKRLAKVQADRTAMNANRPTPGPTLSEKLAAGVRRGVAAFRLEN